MPATKSSLPATNSIHKRQKLTILGQKLKFCAYDAWKKGLETSFFLKRPPGDHRAQDMPLRVIQIMIEAMPATARNPGYVTEF